MRPTTLLFAGLMAGIALASAATVSVVYAASYDDLDYYQKQQFWMCWDTKCAGLLAAQQYGAYRTCSLACFDEAVASTQSQATCVDTDDENYLTKGSVTTNVQSAPTEDFCYDFGDGSAPYLLEGICTSGKQYGWIQKNCAELGAKFVCDAGACVNKNSAPIISPVGDKSVAEGELLKFTVTAVDPDGDLLVWSAEGLPEGAKFENGVFEWVPANGLGGTSSTVSFFVTDGAAKTGVSVKIIVTKKQTNFCGIVSEDTILTKDKSPYLVKCHVLIEKNVALTIQPGVVIKFDGPFYIKVEGALIADGTKDDMIHFTSNKIDPKPGDWDKIKFEDSSVDWSGTSGSVLRYTKIEYSGFFSNETIRINSASPLIENNEITNFLGVGVQGQSLNLSPIIKNNTFSKGGLAIVINGDFKVTNNKITDLDSDGIVCNNGSPLIESNNISGSSTAIRTHGCAPLIKNNIISNSNSGIRLFYYGAGSAIMNNNIMNSSNTGIYVFWSGIVGFSAKIENNIIDNANIGLFLQSSGNNLVVNGNTISNSSIALKIDSSSVAAIKNNTIKDNLTGIHIDTDSQDITLSNNNIYDNSIYSIYLKGPSGNSFGYVKAENNYWGTTDTTLIDKMIFDFYDNFDLPKFIYKPIAQNMFVITP